MKHILLTSVAAAMVLTSTASFAADSNRSSKNRVKSERSYNQRNDDARYARTETSAGYRNNTMWDNQYPTNWNRSKFRAFDSSASAMKRDAYSIEPNDSGVGTEEASQSPRNNSTAN